MHYYTFLINFFHLTSNFLIYSTLDSLNIALRDLQYTPDENWYGREQLEIVADDLGKGTPSTASIYIEVTPVNDAPTITHIDILTLKEDIVTPWSFTNVSTKRRRSNVAVIIVRIVFISSFPF